MIKFYMAYKNGRNLSLCNRLGVWKWDWLPQFSGKIPQRNQILNKTIIISKTYQVIHGTNKNHASKNLLKSNGTQVDLKILTEFNNRDGKVFDTQEHKTSTPILIPDVTDDCWIMWIVKFKMLLNIVGIVDQIRWKGGQTRKSYKRFNR